MSEIIPLHRYPEPDPRWLADLTAVVAADALCHLLAAAIDSLDWVDEDVEEAQSILELATELAMVITDDAEKRPPVTFPTTLTAQAADRIGDTADRFEAHKTYDACADVYDKTAIVIVAAMRQTAWELFRAARSA